MIKYAYTYKQDDTVSTKYNLTAYTGEYKPIFDSNIKNFYWVYKRESSKYKNANIQEPYTIAKGNQKHLTHLKFGSISNPCLAYGDVFRTNDLLLFDVYSNTISIYVLPKMKFHTQEMFDRFCNGELDDEIKNIKAESTLINSVNNHDSNDDR